MWLLMIIFLFIGREQTLKTYDTYAACQRERNRIGYEMAAAYPNDHDFVIRCQFAGKGKMKV